MSKKAEKADIEKESLVNFEPSLCQNPIITATKTARAKNRIAESPYKLLNILNKKLFIFPIIPPIHPKRNQTTTISALAKPISQ